MQFVIQGMKYDTEKMQKVATVKKWYREDTFLNRAMFPGQEVGRTHKCELWKSDIESNTVVRLSPKRAILSFLSV